MTSNKPANLNIEINANDLFILVALFLFPSIVGPAILFYLLGRLLLAALCGVIGAALRPRDYAPPVLRQERSVAEKAAAGRVLILVTLGAIGLIVIGGLITGHLGPALLATVYIAAGLLAFGAVIFAMRGVCVGLCLIAEGLERRRAI